MHRLDRTMRILLLLKDGRSVSAAELAARFGVSPRTIYRDIEALGGLGAPVAAELGRKGGFRLREGYFLPPVALSEEEAVSLLLGLMLMRRLRIIPFPAETELAERKLLAVLPEGTRRLMAKAGRLIGFERVPADLLHREPDDPLLGGGGAMETELVGRFLRAVLSRARLRVRYRSPYRGGAEEREICPRAVFWDRDRWYLVSKGEEAGAEVRLWRSDRVEALSAGPAIRPVPADFDVAELLDRRWLGRAMARWRESHPVRIALSPGQAELLKRDWYFGQACFEEEGGRTVMVYGEGEAEDAAALVRWLGPGAELLEPRAWRAVVARGLRELLAVHEEA